MFIPDLDTFKQKYDAPNSKQAFSENTRELLKSTPANGNAGTRKFDDFELSAREATLISQQLLRAATGCYLRMPELKRQAKSAALYARARVAYEKQFYKTARYLQKLAEQAAR